MRSEPDFAVEQSFHTEAYPGQMFYVEAVAVGQYNGTTPGVVLARAVTSNTTSILKGGAFGTRKQTLMY